MDPELIYKPMFVEGVDKSIFVPRHYPYEPVESLALQWRTSDDVYVLQIKLFRNYRVAHVHALDDVSGQSVYNMSRQQHAFITKGVSTFSTPDCVWFAYEQSVPLQEYIQNMSTDRTMGSQKQKQIIDKLILGFLTSLREIHDMKCFHGCLRVKGSLFVTEEVIPIFGNFQGHLKTITGTKCEDEVKDLKDIKEVLREAIIPMKMNLGYQAVEFTDSFIDNKFTTSSKHLQSVCHHRAFLGIDQLIQYIILTDEKIRHMRHKDRSTIDDKIKKFEGSQSWIDSVPLKYIDVLHFDYERWCQVTDPVYSDTPLGFIHFAGNSGVHKVGLHFAAGR